jgi:hypothetical protein
VNPGERWKCPARRKRTGHVCYLLDAWGGTSARHAQVAMRELAGLAAILVVNVLLPAGATLAFLRATGQGRRLSAWAPVGRGGVAGVLTGVLTGLVAVLGSMFCLVGPAFAVPAFWVAGWLGIRQSELMTDGGVQSFSKYTLLAVLANGAIGFVAGVLTGLIWPGQRRRRKRERG